MVKRLLPLLHAHVPTVTGHSLGENVAAARVHDRDVIASLDQPFRTRGAIAVLRGSLAPNGAVIKPGAANGVLDKPGMADTWRFQAKKGQTVEGDCGGIILMRR